MNTQDKQMTREQKIQYLMDLLEELGIIRTNDSNSELPAGGDSNETD